MISRECEATILRLSEVEKWKVGTIADQLGIHHDAVERVLEQGGTSTGPRQDRPSILDPFVPFIKETFTKYPKICASRVYQMVRERGYAGGPDHFRHVVAPLRPPRPAEAYLRLRTLPGE